jgi:hypothetical protein
MFCAVLLTKTEHLLQAAGYSSAGENREFELPGVR